MQPAMLGSHLGWITLLLDNLRTIPIISTVGNRYGRLQLWQERSPGRSF